MSYRVEAILSAVDSGFTSKFNQATKSVEKLQNQAGKVSSVASKIGSATESIGKSLTTKLTLPLGAAFTYAGKQFADFETGLVGVGKTTGMAGKDLKGFGDDIAKMSSVIPVSTKDLLGLSETAGQLGIHGKKDLLEFTRVMAEMGSATNLAGEEGALVMARFANVMGLDVGKNIRQVGNAVVRLGNNFETSEAEIMNMSSRLAASSRLVGITTPNVLGLATAMSSVGIEAEAGGTAMSTVMTKVDKAVASGGEKLQNFANVAGMSAEDFAAKWKSKPTEALEDLMKGLDSASKSGGNMNQILDMLGIKGVRESNAVKSLAQNHELLSEAIKQSNDAYNYGNDLAEEAAKAWGTLHAKLTTLKNTLGNIAKDIFSIVAPALKDMVDKVNELASKWYQLSDSSKEAIGKVILKIGGLLAAIGPVLLIGGKITKTLSPVIGVVSQVGNAFKTATGILSNSGSLFSSVSDGMKNAAGSLGDKFLEVGSKFPAFGNKALEMYDKMSTVPGKIQSGFTSKIGQAIGSLDEKFGTHFQSMGSKVRAFGGRLSSGLGKAGSLLSSFGINTGNMVSMANAAMGSLFPAAVIGIALAGLGVLYSQFGDQIDKLLQIAKEKGPEIITNLGNGITEKIPEFVSKGAELVSRLAETISANIPTILTVGANIVIALVESVGNNAGQLIGAAVQIIGSLLQGILQNLPRLLVAGVQLIGQLVSGIVQNIPKILQTGREAITGFISGLSQALPQLLSSGVKIIFEIIKGIVTNIPQVIATGAKIILELGKAIIGAIGTIVGTVGSAIGGFFKKIFSPGKSEAAQTNQEVTSETQSMSTNVTGIMEGLTSSVASSTSAMQSNVTSSYAGMAETMSTNFNQGVDAVTGASQNLSGIVPQDATNTSEQSATAYEQLSQRTQTAMDSMANSVEGSMSKISTTSTSGLQNLSTGFTNTFNQITNTVNQGTNQVINSVNTMNARVTNAFSNFSSRFISTNRNMWTQFTSLSQQALNKNYSSFNSFTNKMSSRYKTFASQMRNSTNQMWRSVVNQTRQSGNNMAQSFANACQRTVSLANQLRSNLISIMNSSVGGMRSAGYNAGMGFYSGLASTRGSIMGLASSIAASVSARIRSALRIHSPSRVLMNLGSYAGEGLAVGLEKSKRYVNNAVDGLSNTIKGVDTGLNSSFSDFNTNSKATPLVINLRLGNNEFRAISRDITQEQGKDLRLEANFGI